MNSMGNTRDGDGRQDQPPANAVREALRGILESQPFRTSKQCQDMLRYIVEHSLSGDETALKERIIGTAVFGRKPSYDTNDDPVVRVRAADVRKRLAQYYQSLAPDSQVVRMEILPGSYRAHFHPAPSKHISDAPPTAPSGAPDPQVEPAPVPASIPPAVRKFRLPLAKAAVLFVILATLAGVSTWWYETNHNQTTPQQKFWAPFLTAKQPVLIYLGTNAVYAYGPDFLAKYRAAHNMPNEGPEFYVHLPPGTMVHAEDVVPIPDTFVSTSDLSAVVQLITLFQSWSKPFEVRTGRDLAFGDLRNRPSVMIGAFNNTWTLAITKELPYSFLNGTEVLNRDHPEQSWTIGFDSKGETTDDYAILSRLMTSKTGGPAITAAGIGEYGTQAAAEFLASPERMREFLKTAPSGWENRNMQLVLHVKAVDYQPVQVDVIATSYW